MSGTTHIIKHQVLEITVPGQQHVSWVQEEVSRVLRDEVWPALEKVFDEYAPPGRLIRIDSIEIDVGKVRLSHLQKDLMEQVLHQFPKELKDRIDYAAYYDNEEVEVIEMTEFDLQLLVTFLSTGAYPWNAGQQVAPSWDEILTSLLNKTPEPLAAAMRSGVREVAFRKRLAYQFSAIPLGRLMVWMRPELGEYAFFLAQDLAVLHQKSPILSISEARWRETILVELFEMLEGFSTTDTSVQRAAVFAKLMHQVAQQFSLSPEELVWILQDRLIGPEASGLGFAADLREQVKAAFDQLPSDFVETHSELKRGEGPASHQSQMLTSLEANHLSAEQTEVKREVQKDSDEASKAQNERDSEQTYNLEELAAETGTIAPLPTEKKETLIETNQEVDDSEKGAQKEVEDPRPVFTEDPFTTSFEPETSEPEHKATPPTDQIDTQDEIKAEPSSSEIIQEEQAEDVYDPEVAPVEELEGESIPEIDPSEDKRPIYEEDPFSISSEPVAPLKADNLAYSEDPFKISFGDEMETEEEALTLAKEDSETKEHTERKSEAREERPSTPVEPEPRLDPQEKDEPTPEIAASAPNETDDTPLELKTPQPPKDHDEGSVDPQVPTSQKPPKVTPEDLPEALKAAMERERKKREKKYPRRQEPPVPKPSPPLSIPYRSPDEEIFVKNAGLVILCAYIGRFFGYLGLVKDRAFVSDEARIKAVHLLQFLAVGFEGPYPEQELTMNKLIVGMPFDEPVPAEYPLTDEEKEAAEGLLKAVIQNWGRLGNTSPMGLRGSFLLRAGKIKKVNKGWRVKVEEKALDVLVKGLPWGIETTRLSWNDYTIFVEWV